MPHMAPITQLSPIHHQIALLSAQGLRAEAIAEETGLNFGYINSLLRNPIMREQRDKYRKEIEQETLAYAVNKLTTLHVKAVDTLEHLLDHGSDGVRLGAVREVFDRGPLRLERHGGQQGNGQGTVVIQEKMLLALKQAAEVMGDTEILAAFSHVETHAPSSSPTQGQTPSIEEEGTAEE